MLKFHWRVNTAPYVAMEKGVSEMKHFYWVSIVGNELKLSRCFYKRPIATNPKKTSNIDLLSSMLGSNLL